MELALIILIAVVIGMYYGFGRNLEISSGMLTRELEDAERSQKERIVTARSKAPVNDTVWKKAVENINKIDELDI